MRSMSMTKNLALSLSVVFCVAFATDAFARKVGTRPCDEELTAVEGVPSFERAIKIFRHLYKASKGLDAFGDAGYVKDDISYGVRMLYGDLVGLKGPGVRRFLNEFIAYADTRFEFTKKGDTNPKRKIKHPSLVRLIRRAWGEDRTVWQVLSARAKDVKNEVLAVRALEDCLVIVEGGSKKIIGFALAYEIVQEAVSGEFDPAVVLRRAKNYSQRMTPLDLSELQRIMNAP